MRSPITRHSIWQVGVDAGLVALAWWLAWNLRFESRPVYYDRYLDWEHRPPRRRDQAPGLRALGLLQPLVALRLDARHVGGVPRRRPRLGRGLPRLHALRRAPGRGPARRLVHRPAALPRARGRLAPPRANADRAPAARPHRRAREGRRRRRRGRCRAARRQGDAAQPGARLHADRAARRRPAQAEPAAPRRPRARHDRRSRSHPPRSPARRGAHRDPDRVGRAAGPDRRDRARASTSR